MVHLLLTAVLVFGVNLLPAFGPPTWSVLVALELAWGLPAVALVLVGALAAAAGRYCLARGAHAGRGRLAPRRREGLEALRASLSGNRTGAIAGLGLFALSPVPSAQLFVGAGLTGVRLVPLTAAFFAGRIVSYGLYVGAAHVAGGSLGPVLLDSLRSPLGDRAATADARRARRARAARLAAAARPPAREGLAERGHRPFAAVRR